MFEAIAISSRSAPGREFSVGDLAECLLYYGKVHLVGNGGLIDLPGEFRAIHNLETAPGLMES